MPSQTIIINNKKMKFLIIFCLLISLAIYILFPETVLISKNNTDYECRCSGITIQKDQTFIYNCLGYAYNCIEWYPLGVDFGDNKDQATMIME